MIEPTPGTVWTRGTTMRSSISTISSRENRVELNDMENTGLESGSALLTRGGSISAGSFTRLTRSRMSFAASSILRPRLNSIVTVERCSEEFERTSRMPSMAATSFSIGSVTFDSTTCAEAPG